MDPDTIIAVSSVIIASALAITALNKKRHRRYAVRPMNRRRDEYGHYSTLVRFMKDNDHEQFFKYCRMSPAMYDHLLALMSPHLQKDVKKMHLSPGHRLTITLHYLAEGCSMQQIAWDYYIGKATAHFVIKSTCQALWKVLSPIYLPKPNKADWEDIADGFYKRWNIPNCVGALDGKHVQIQAPHHSGSLFFNYKKSFSIVLMATCDAFYKFKLVDIGAEGSQHDSSVFKNSNFGKSLLLNQLDFPNDRSLPFMETSFPYFFVADQAFPLHERIMRPYPGECLSEEKRIYNYRLSRARRTIENTFGILAQRWRCLRKPIVANLETCQQILQATVVLHNYVQRNEEDLPMSERKYCPTGFADYVDSEGNFHFGQWRTTETMKSVGRMGTNNPTRNAQKLRETLKQYFNSDIGCVPWQQDIILQGSLPSDNK